MDKSLPVPYKSQWDNDATLSNNDCGPASLAMVLNYYGENLTTNQLTQMTGAGGNLVSISQMIQAAASLGYSAQFLTGELGHIKALIDNNIPVIPLVHYGSLISTQDKIFKGGHFFVVVGYRPDDSLYVNDPNFRDLFRKDGDHHVYTKDEFLKAWADCALDQNPVNSFIVIYPKAASNLIGTVTIDAGLNVRSAPHLSATVLGHVAKGDSFPIAGFIEGDQVLDSNCWCILKGGEAYVWAGGVSVVDNTPPLPPQEEKIPVTPVQARAAQVLSDALINPEIVTMDGLHFGNEEGLARNLVGEWPKYLKLVVAEKKSKNLLEQIASLLGFK